MMKGRRWRGVIDGGGSIRIRDHGIALADLQWAPGTVTSGQDIGAGSGNREFVVS